MIPLLWFGSPLAWLLMLWRDLAIRLRRAPRSWRCTDCDCLNMPHEWCCYRCGAGHPDGA
jgi:hypothetical protein